MTEVLAPPVGEVLTAETVKLLRAGDQLLHTEGSPRVTYDGPQEAFDYHDRNGAHLTRDDGTKFILKDGYGIKSVWWANLSFLARPSLAAPIVKGGEELGSSPKMAIPVAAEGEASLHILTEEGLRGPTYSGSPPWTCFHCGFVAETREKGLLHFGRAEDCAPICGVAAETYRQMEQTVWEYRNECDAASKTFYSLGAEHQTKLREAEQTGYDRGLADGQSLLGVPTSTCGIAPSGKGAPAAGEADVSRLIETIEARLIGVRPDDQDVVLEDDDWKMIVYALGVIK